MLTQQRDNPVSAHLEHFRAFETLDLGSRLSVVIAVSGGSDSVALLTLMLSHLRSTDSPCTPIVATVDHGLREGAAGEAAAVGRWCHEWGIEHRTLHWRESKPETGIQDKARQARQQLLAAFARDRGTDLVLTGHTGDDRAETVAMRHQRTGTGDQGQFGLAGIAPATLYDDRIWFARPLLGHARSQLRAYLEETGQGWVDDPSNDDRRFERIRVRGSMDDAARARWLEIADKAAAERSKASADAAEIIRAGAMFAFDDWPESLTINRQAFNGADQTAAAAALRMTLPRLTGDAYPPSGKALADIAEFIRTAPTGRKLTAARCVFSVSRTEATVIGDPRAALADKTLTRRVPSFDWPLALALHARIGGAGALPPIPVHHGG